MTCVVGIRGLGGAVIVADKLGVDTSSLYATKRADPKVFNLTDWFAVGFTDSYRFGQILQHHLDVSTWEPPASGQRHAFAVRTVIPAMRAALREHGWLRVDNVALEQSGTCILAVCDEVFVVYSDFQVEEPLAPYTAIGSGRDVALGFMACDIGSRSASYGLPVLAGCGAAAISAASQHNAGVSRSSIHVSTVAQVEAPR